jgi:N-acetylglutamate synthase-like GNAT family acetyltransferase
MITVREATGRDVPAIQDIFLASYGTDYTDRRYYDEALLTRLVYSDASLLLVAEEAATGRVVGTASVDLEVGAYADLVGEFGRLAVHPEFRHSGVGKLLMTERLRRTSDRLHVGLVEARVVHPYALKVAEAHQFAVVGFLPLKWRLRQRESLALLAHYFGNALELRNNHPRVIPEVYPLAHLSLENCALPADAIVDETAPAYPPGGAFAVQELTTEGYAALLRIERGRVRHREIFGPVRLHYGIFKLQARRSRYLIAREDGRIAGAVGYTLDPLDGAVRIFELIALHDEVIRFLLIELDRACREAGGFLVEVDVSAYAPRMQRTLLELGFLPVAYIPAVVFHEVERLDVVKMLRLSTPPAVCTDGLTPRCKAMADLVLRRFRSRSVLPRVAEAVGGLPLFGGLDAEQVTRLAGVCGVSTFEPGQVVFREGQPGDQMHVVLQGEVAITVAGSDRPVLAGVVRGGECLGELSLLRAGVHSATATARTHVETAVLGHQDLAELIRLRPDIGLHLYRNVAVGMGEKLKRLDASLASQGEPQHG